MKKVFIIALLLSQILIGCNNEANINNAYRQVNFSEEQQEELLIDLLSFICNNDTDSSNYLSSEVKINDDDIITDLGLYEPEFYISRNAAYVKIKEYMYRFQFDNSGKVVSYIKYTVEA